MANKKLNVAAVYATIIGMAIFWCSRYSLYFFKSNAPLDFFPILFVEAALLVLFLILYRLKLPKWVTIAALSLEAVCFLTPLAIMFANLPNFPHFLNNLAEILPYLVLLLAAVSAYMFYENIKRSTVVKIAALSVVGALVVTGLSLTLPAYNTSSAAVFDTGSEFTVEFISNRRGLGFVEVEKDGKTTTYYHTGDGKKVAHTEIHQIKIPKEALYGGTYRTGVRSVFFTVSNHTFFGNTCYGKKTEFRKPVSFEGASFVTVSDVHSQIGAATKAVHGLMDKLDFIVFLGDIVSFSGNKYDLTMLVDFMATVSKGEIPVLYVRGNHELMGEGADALKAYIPTPENEFYYSISYNNAYFIVNDLAADKGDDNAGFSGLSDGENYRKMQKDFTSKAIAESERTNAEYLVHISHIPVSVNSEPLKSNMTEIVNLLNGKADVSICGHTHKFVVEKTNDRVKFPVVQDGGNTNTFGSGFIGAHFVLKDGNITAYKIDGSGKTLETFVIK